MKSPKNFQQVAFGKAVPSVEDRRQVSGSRFVIESNAHQRHRLNYAEAVFQTPAEQLSIAGRQEKSGTLKLNGCADQGFQFFIGLTDRMT